MIKLGNTSELYEQSNKSVKGYEIIKPSHDMTDSEMMRFVDDVFSDSKVESWDELSDADYLDWAEEDIDVDYHISDELKTLARKFNSYEWWAADDDERYYFISDFADELASSLGIVTIPEVIITDNIGDSCGCYYNSDNTIMLNRAYLSDGPETLNTIAHEMRHAYQYERSRILETPNDYFIKENLDNYISPIKLPNGDWLNYIEYYYQYVEVDARVFADMFTEATK